MFWNRDLFVLRGSQLIGGLLAFVALHSVTADVVDKTTREQAHALAETGVRFELDGAPRYAQYAWQAALRSDPNCALARWRLGYIRSGDEWVAAGESPSDQRTEEFVSYTKQRDGNLDEGPRELTLAFWCRNNGLLERSEVHFQRVFDNRDAPAEARQRAANALGLREFGGEMRSPEQIQELRTQLRQAQLELNFWSKKLAEPLRQLQSSRHKKRQLGLESLRQIDDPAAIPALELSLSTFGEIAAYEAVGIIKRIEGPEAAESLARHAIVSEWPSVRKEAIRQLQQRPPQEYVPMLLGVLRMPIRSVFQIAAGEDGQILHEHMFHQEGIEEHRQLTLATTAVSPAISDDTDQQDELTRVRRRARRIETEILATNTRNSQQNQRVFEILRETTGEQFSSDPTAWWDWWKNYNEYEIATNKPVRSATRSRQYTYQSSIPTRIATAGTGGGGRSCECFPQGTLVWTEIGKQTIETIRAGDRVLSQNPDTGELSYKLVTGVTLRRQAPMQTVTLGDHELTLTTGHPLWVNGSGWRMAKLLKLGDQVHCMDGAKGVSSMVKSPRGDAYNLIVDDFGSYFVTELGVLVHDNTYRKPNRAVSPGLVAKN